MGARRITKNRCATGSANGSALPTRRPLALPSVVGRRRSTSTVALLGVSAMHCALCTWTCGCGAGSRRRRQSSALKTQTKLCSELSLIHALISSGTQVQEGPPDRPPSRPAARTSSAARRRTGLRQGYHTRRAVHERPKHALGRPQPWPQHSSQHTPHTSHHGFWPSSRWHLARRLHF